MQGARTACGRRRAVGFAASLALLLTLGSGCSQRLVARDGQVTENQADNYLSQAIRKSSEGVVIDPSQQGLDQIERTRFGEIAQELRAPAARCFLERAIETMEPGLIDGEPGWLEVPEGQAKIRARVSVDGNVMSTDVLESGFDDDEMESCLSRVIAKQRFVESRDSFAYYVDIYYWVSLGFFAEAHSESFATLLRRRQAEAAQRALPCLQGRVRPGTYPVTGLNLFDRDGNTVINRIERGALPVEVSTCIASVFKQIRIHEEPESFIRPATPAAEFSVADDGAVSFADARWLQLIELEERADRERRKAELLGDAVDDDGPDGFVDLGEPDPTPPPKPTPKSEPKSGPKSEPKSGPRPDTPVPSPEVKPEADPVEPDPVEPAPEPKPQPTGDPTKPGTKIDLSPRRGR